MGGRVCLSLPRLRVGASLSFLLVQQQAASTSTVSSSDTVDKDFEATLYGNHREVKYFFNSKVNQNGKIL